MTQHDKARIKRWRHSIADPKKIVEHPDGEWVCYNDLTALADENARLREALAWYGEQARLARLIHSDGDIGRHALADDGGNRARAALSSDKGGE